jgi:biotin synthase-related radical SAM superfamily protein
VQLQSELAAAEAARQIAIATADRACVQQVELDSELEDVKTELENLKQGMSTLLLLPLLAAALCRMFSANCI